MGKILLGCMVIAFSFSTYSWASETSKKVRKPDSVEAWNTIKLIEKIPAEVEVCATSVNMPKNTGGSGTKSIDCSSYGDTIDVDGIAQPSRMIVEDIRQMKKAGFKPVSCQIATNRYGYDCFYQR